MTSRTQSAVVRAAFGALALAATLVASPAFADPQMSAVTGQMEERKAGLVSEGTAKRINQLLELVTNEQYDEAIAGFKALQPKVAGNAYEEALVLQNMGYVHLSKGGDSDFKLAITAFEKALALKALPIPTENSMVYNLAQLNMQIENYPKAITLLESWFKATVNPPAAANILMANALGLTNRWREALPYVQKAIASTDKPQESWYKLLLAAQYELKDFKGCSETLEILTSLYPDNKKYWEQLSGMYMELNEDSKALATMGLAYRKGFVSDEKQLLNLARMYILNDAPFEAGKLLDQAIAAKQVAATDKNYALMAEAWIQAREWNKATDVLGKGCDIAADGEMCVRKAQIHVDQLEYNAAVKSVDRAFQKGTLKRPGYAYMIQGRAAAETRNFKAAEEAFKKARGFEETKNSASTWLDYLQELQAAR
jgi:predicted Zn-dependent protease